MRKSLFFITMLLSFLDLFAKVITISATEWKPYTSDNLQGKGFFSEVAVSALKLAGYDADVKIYPWARALEMTKAGNSDALLGASYLKERESFLSYPDKIWISQASFWCKKDNPVNKYESLEKLAPVRIGVVNGSNFVQELSNIKGIEIETVPDNVLNIKKLVAGRMPYFLESSDNVNFLLNGELKEYKGKIRMLAPPYMEDSLFLVFSKKNPDWQLLTRDFNSGLRKLKSSGMYKKIAVKHKMMKSTDTVR